MGRFRIPQCDDADDFDDDYDENEDPQWEFVAGETSEEGALVVREESSLSAAQEHADKQQERRRRPRRPTQDACSDDDDDNDNEESVTTTSRRRNQQRNMMWRGSQDLAEDWDTVPHHLSNDYWEWLEKERSNHSTYRSSNSSRSSLLRRFLWLVSFLVVLIALLWKDPPPAPPPQQYPATTEEDPAGGWSDYIQRHGRQLHDAAKALGLDAPRHIVAWWATSVYTDVQLFYERYQHQRLSKCQLRQQPLPNLLRSLQLVGQPLAVEWLTEGLQARQGAGYNNNNNSNNNNNNNILLIWAIGYPHTGKRTLARQLASQIVHNCDDNRRAVLTIPGTDWSRRIDDEYHHSHHQNDIVDVVDVDPSAKRNLRVEVRLERLVTTIVTHVQLYGFTVVLVSNVEDMDSDLFKLFMKWIGSACHNDAIRPAHDNQQSSQLLQGLCGNVILYFTTSTGKALEPITRSLRVSGEDLRQAVAGLPADLRDAVQRNFGVVSTTTPTILLLPFGPFTPDRLAELLLLKVADYSVAHAGVAWQRLTITPAAVRAFLDPRRVEYLEWKSRSGVAAATSETGPDEPPPQHFMTVALEGAAVLDDRGPVMTKIFAQTRQFMLTEQAQPDQVAVVDYDDSSTFLLSDERRGLLQWCDRSGHGQCQTVSRFRM